MSQQTRNISLRSDAGVRAFAVSPDSRRLAVSQYGIREGDALLSLFDLASLRLIKEIEHYHDNSILSPAFNRESNLLLYSKDDYVIHFFDPQTGKLVDSIETPLNKKIVSSPQSGKIICSGQFLEVWDGVKGELLCRLEDYESFKIANAGSIDTGSLSWLRKDLPPSYTTEPAAACFNPLNDNEVFYTGINEPRIFKLDVLSKKSRVLINDGVLQANDMQLSPDGKWIAVSSRIPAGDFAWDMATGKRVAEDVVNDKYGSGSALCFHPSESRLALGSLVGYVTIVDLMSTDIIYSEKIHAAKINQLQFLNGGDRIISASDDGRLTITNLTIK